MARLIDGKQISSEMRDKFKVEIARLKAKTDRVPGLAVVLVGDNPASKVYVGMKNKSCIEAGMNSFEKKFPPSITESFLLEQIHFLNEDKLVNGILVQLPLPKHIRTERVLEAISPEKDVDGFHPMNVGKLVTGGETFFPCTPFGIIKLLESTGEKLDGKSGVVVGRSNIVGKPVAFLMLQKNMTVTICHSKTQDLPGVVRSGDVVVAAIGKAEMVKGDWIKPGAIVIDVGINRMEDGKLKGDVEFGVASERASFITPVPGGVGPMTIAMLLSNTLDSFKRTIS
ncbi:bifunctional methylenetetrahydrofolate dehydrogenase/methenyltetrahydrofolate cyclohydrolase FolD [bacterium]|nr:bifunctional methylenetetrahydrofolate dehydrogenase/methenyltetrahydrofolate cyclohydrolase FolD [bacterium]